MKVRCGIYKITNLTNGNFYVGQSQDLTRRKRNHFNLLRKGTHRNKHLQMAFNKYGESNFTFTILLYCELIEATRYEQMIVDRYKPQYNIFKECVASARGLKRTKEQNKKRSELFKGHPVSQAARDKMREAWKTRQPATKESRAKMAQSQLGRTHSPETKLKMSLVRAKHWESEEAIQKMSEVMTLRWQERKGKQYENSI